MTFQKGVVNEKLNRISGYLDEAKNLFRFSTKEILADSEKLHIAERLFQLIVDEIIDINQHFIKELGFDLSNDLEGTFHIMGENNILSQDFVLKISPVVGLRNRLVHRYEKLDPKIFIESFQKEYSDFEKYIKFILGYLENKQT